MPRPIDIGLIHGEFRARIDELLDFERCIPAMTGAGNPRRKEWTRRRLCEGALVLAFSHWERFIEQLFCAYLSQDVSQLGKSLGLDLEGSVLKPTAEALVAGERYFDFKSYGDIKGRARKMLARHRFDKVKVTDQRALDAIQALRDQILHRSRHSTRRLQALVQRRVDPGTHLAARKGGMTRLKHYLSIFKSASRAVRTRSRRA